MDGWMHVECMNMLLFDLPMHFVTHAQTSSASTPAPLMCCVANTLKCLNQSSQTCMQRQSTIMLTKTDPSTKQDITHIMTKRKGVTSVASGSFMLCSFCSTSTGHCCMSASTSGMPLLMCTVPPGLPCTVNTLSYMYIKIDVII